MFFFAIMVFSTSLIIYKKCGGLVVCHMATRAEDVVSNPEFSEFFRCMCDIRYLHLKFVTSYEGKHSEETSTNLQRKNDSMESVKFPIRTGNYSQWASQNRVTFSSRTQIGWND